MKKTEVGRPAGGHPIEGQFEAFSHWLQDQRCSAATVSQYIGVCRKFGRYLDGQDVSVDAVHDGHVDDFLDQLKPRRGSLIESRRYYRTGIGRLLDYFQDAGICPTPIEPYRAGYAALLRDRGHTEKTVAQYVSTCDHFGRYLRRTGIEIAQVSEDEIEKFVKQHPLPRARRPDRTIIQRDYRHRLALFLAYLRDSGACPRANLQTPTESAWVADYLAFLRDHRGLCVASIEDQKRHLKRFLAHVGVDGTTEQLRSLSIQHADEFLIEAARSRNRTSMGGVCATVRGFFGFLHMRGVLPVNLREQVTTPLIYQQERVPRAAPWIDVEKTLALVDRSTLVGCRDYAILSLLAYYGLRACEVATLRVSDLDWRRDVLYVHRAKGGDTEALPLLPIVGEALVDYLKLRPSSERAEMFLKVIAPTGSISSASVSWLARKYLLAAGVKAPLLGSHTLRHSHAVRLLRAGFPLKTIGDTLGHRNPQSTFIYAKAATEDLRSVALDLNEVRP